MRTWPNDLQEKSVKFLIESTMGIHTGEYITLCHTSGLKGYIHYSNAFNHEWILETFEDSQPPLQFNSALEIVKNGWIVEGVQFKA